MAVSRAVRDRTVDKALVRAKEINLVEVTVVKVKVVAAPQVATPITH